MSKAVGLREDFDADVLRGLARTSRNAGQSRRLLALAAIYEGASRTQAARIGAVGLQTVRWPAPEELMLDASHVEGTPLGIRRKRGA